MNEKTERLEKRTHKKTQAAYEANFIMLAQAGEC